MNDLMIVMRRIFSRNFRFVPVALAFLLPAIAIGGQSPVLFCSFHSLGEEKNLSFQVSDDPYQAPLVAINRHFSFKAVMVAGGAGVRYVKLYTYLPSRGKFVLLHQASYANPPVSDGSDPFALTGEQRLYSPSYERELLFGCALRENES